MNAKDVLKKEGKVWVYEPYFPYVDKYGQGPALLLFNEDNDYASMGYDLRPEVPYESRWFDPTDAVEKKHLENYEYFGTDPLKIAKELSKHNEIVHITNCTVCLETVEAQLTEIGEFSCPLCGNEMLPANGERLTYELE